MIIRLAVATLLGAAAVGTGVAGTVVRAELGPPAHVEPGSEEARAALDDAGTQREPGVAFAAAMRAWASCVGTAAPKHPGPEPFAPEEACGPRPSSPDGPEEEGAGAAFGEENSERARADGQAFGRSVAEEASGGRAGGPDEDEPEEEADENGEGGPPDGVPGGPPGS